MTLEPPVKIEPDRDRFGRPMVIPPSGGKPIPYSRCTTYVGCLEDTWNLSKWQQRMVAAGLSQRPDLQLRAASLGLQPVDEAEKKRWKSQMDEVTEAATEAAQAAAAATIGTSVHALTERLDRGMDVGVIPDQYRKHLEAYQQATADMTAVHIERFTVCDGMKIGGTPDRILQVPGEDQLIVGDVKTGDVRFGILKMCMQLAVYAHSQLYDLDTGARAPIGDVNLEKGLIIGLSAATGEVEMFWVDLAAGWDAVKTAGDVRYWRSRDRAPKLTEPYRPAGQQGLFTAELSGEAFAGPAGTPAQPIPAPQPLVSITADTPLVKVIQQATSEPELVQIWQQADQQGLWEPRHTELAAQRKAELAA